MQSLAVRVAVVVATLALSAGPAYADNVEYAGLTCGLETWNDPTGLINENPDEQFGTMHGGPWVAADVVDDTSPGPTHLELANITIHCWVQINNATPMHALSSSAHCDSSGTGVAFGICLVNYTATSQDNVYLCTWVVMHHDGMTEEYLHDASPEDGIQCALAIRYGERPLPECVLVVPGLVVNGPDIIDSGLWRTARAPAVRR